MRTSARVDLPEPGTPSTISGSPVIREVCNVWKLGGEMKYFEVRKKSLRSVIDPIGRTSARRVDICSMECDAGAVSNAETRLLVAGVIGAGSGAGV